MKKIMTMMAMLTFAICLFAKDIKTVVFTTQPQMHCESCENKIKGNLRFEKGIKDIATSVPDQKVTIKDDADKTTPENIVKGFAKIGYEAKVVGDDAKKGCTGCAKKTGEKKGSCCGGNKPAEKKGSCCGGNKPAEKKGSCCGGSKPAEKKQDGCSGCAKEADAKKGGCCTE